MSMDELEMHVVNGSEIILDDNLLNNSIEAVTVNSKRLLISAYRPSPDDEVRLSTEQDGPIVDLFYHLANLHLNCFVC